MKKELTEQQAIALSETNFWESLTPDEIVRFQLFEPRLCMPFTVFHESLEAALNRPVFVHELAFDRIKSEFLGDSEPPTMDDIINLIPEEKRIIAGL